MARSEKTTKKTGRPRPPVAASNIKWQPWKHGERFGGRVRVLSNTRQGAHVGVLIEELPPGKQSCPAHYHMLEEEHIYVLEGRVTLRLGEDTHVLKPGDFVSFPAGQAAGHCLVNHTRKPCRYLVVGEKNPSDVCVYPDSNKILVCATDEIYDKGAIREYWAGEDAD